MKKILGVLAVFVSMFLVSGMASATSFQSNLDVSNSVGFIETSVNQEVGGATSFGANWDVSNAQGHIKTSVDQNREAYKHKQVWDGNSEGFLQGDLGGTYNPKDTEIYSESTGKGYLKDISDYDYMNGEIRSRQEFSAEASESIEVQDFLKGDDYMRRTSDGLGSWYREDNAFLHFQGFETKDTNRFTTGFQGKEEDATVDMNRTFSSNNKFDAYSGLSGNKQGATDIHSWNDDVGIDSGERGFNSEAGAYDSGWIGDFDSGWTAN